MGDADELVREAYTHHRAGRLSPAQELYTRALAVEPEHLAALFGLGSILLHRRQGEAARKVWGRVTTLYPEMVEAIANLGLAYQMAGSPEQAEECFRRALAQKPQAPDLHCHLAQLKLEQGEQDVAWSLYRRALELEPDNPATLHQVGTAQARAGNWLEAVNCFSRLAELRPEDWKVLSDLGSLLRRAGRAHEAREALERALALDPDNPHISNNLAAACLSLGQWDRSRDLLGRVVTLMPDWIGARLNLGYALLAQGRPAEATLEFIEAVERDEGDPAALGHLGRAFYLQGNLEAAAEVFDRELALSPEARDAMAGKATLLLLAGRRREAWALIRRRYLGIRHPVARDLPLWDSAEPGRGRVLVWADCGLAEALAALPALEALAERGLEPWLETPDGWHVLLTGVKGCAGLAGPDRPWRDFACQAPLAVLPALLDMQPPARPEPCLSPPPAGAVTAWRQRMAGLGTGPKLGLAWASRDGTPWDAVRTPGPECWGLLAGGVGAALVPLSPGPPPETLLQAGMSPDGPPPPEEPAELAALMAALDALVLPEGWMAAWAGAMGAPAWVLLGPGPGWVWGGDGPRSPWLPGPELIRAQGLDDWSGAGAELAAALARWAGGRGA